MKLGGRAGICVRQVLLSEGRPEMVNVIHARIFRGSQQLATPGNSASDKKNGAGGEVKCSTQAPSFISM